MSGGMGYVDHFYSLFIILQTSCTVNELTSSMETKTLIWEANEVEMGNCTRCYGAGPLGLECTTMT